MCVDDNPGGSQCSGLKTVPIAQAVGLVLAHDISEIRRSDFKGRAFRKGHIIRAEDICHLRKLGKEHLYVLDLAEDEMHEDDAACAMASALPGIGVTTGGSPHEGKVDLFADRNGLFRVKKDALLEFNMIGEVMCATLHDNSVVTKGQLVAGTRAIPLVIKRGVVERAVEIARSAGGILEVSTMRAPRVGVVITGNEIYQRRIRDAFAPVIIEKIASVSGEIVGLHYAPDDAAFIAARLRDLLGAGADLLIATGGMSVDPDDVTRLAVKSLGAIDVTYGSAVLPGAMFLIAHLHPPRSSAPGSGAECDGVASRFIPVLGIPACAMYARVTILDLVLPRILAGQRIGRRELAELGHGGLCMRCEDCRYPQCPFGRP